MAYTIMLDAGHGGDDTGAIYQNREEKDDNLRLTLEVGRILEENGVNVLYTRTEDVYQTPFEKAQIANSSGADYFISIHRNSSPLPNQYSGVETLLYDLSGTKLDMAENINSALSEIGFENLGVQARPGLVILRRSQMPALLVEVGYINNEDDNAMYDSSFDDIAQAIAGGILETLNPENAPPNMNQNVPVGTMPGSTNRNVPGGTMPGSTNRNVPGRTMSGDMDRNVPGRTMPGDMDRNVPGRTMPGDMDRNVPGGIMPGNRNRNVPGGTMPGSMNPNVSGSAMPSNMGSNAPGSSTSGNNQQPGSSPRPPMDQEMNEKMPLYRVQVGLFRQRQNADRLLYELLEKGYPAFLLDEDGFFKVQVGAYRQLGNAIIMERRLRKEGYSTLITT